MSEIVISLLGATASMLALLAAARAARATERTRVPIKVRADEEQER